MLQLDKRHLRREEGYIAPPMRHVTTIPVLRDGDPSGVVVYVGVSAFISGDRERDAHLAARVVARHLALDYLGAGPEVNK